MNQTVARVLHGLCLILVFGMLTPLSSHAGLEQPPLSIFGRLETPSGEEITTGDLFFTMTQPNLKSIVVEKAKLSRLANGLTFTVSFDVEQVPVSDAQKVLKFDTSYLPSATFNGQPLELTGWPETITPSIGSVVGPVTISATPDGPVLVLSEDISFGQQKVNTSQLRPLTIKNVGSQTLLGTARMKNGSHFRIIEQGVAINQAEIEIEAQSAIIVDIRFLPTLLSEGLFDEVIVETNGGTDSRVISGQSVVDAPEVTPTASFTPTPTRTPTPTPTATYQYDIAPDERDGKVNPLDFLKLLDRKETDPGSFSPEVLFDFAREWSP